MTNTATTTTPVVFLQGKNWMLSTPTRIGFQHTKIGTLTGIHDRDEAITRAQELLDAGQISR